MRIGSLNEMSLRSLAIQLVGFCILVMTQGCTKAPPSAILGNRELADKTDVFIGDEQYYLTAKDASGHEVESDSSMRGSNDTAADEADDQTDGESVAPKSNQKLTSPSASKPKAKPKPVDIEYVLTKAKDISVGMTSDSPNSRIQNDERTFIPASITKVITTAAALRTLGPEFKYKTKVGYQLSASGQASGLIISADGDPTVGIASFESDSTQRMREIAQLMKSRGVRELVGEVRLVSADPRLDVPEYASGISKDDMRECYGALSSSFNFQRNCVPVRLHARDGFVWESAEIAQFITTSVSTQASDHTSLMLEPVLTPDRLFQGFQLQGFYQAKAIAVKSRRLPIGNGAVWYAHGLFAALREQKIVIVKPIVSFVRTLEERSKALEMLATYKDSTLVFESAPMSKIIEATNKPSDNFFADSIFKAIGSHSAAQNVAVIEGSRTKIREILADWLRVDGHSSWSNELAFFDGAGLSAENRATPRAFLAVLRSIAHEPTFPSLWESLPIAGVDGTLESRMRNTSAAGVVRGKTGTLNGSYQLVGFVPKSRAGRTDYIPFVILTSTTARNRNLVRRFQDAIVAKMSDVAAHRD